MQGGFQISRKSDYALRAVIYLARNEGQHPVSFRQIAQTEYIPEEYLAKILRTLVLVRLVSSTRGAKGGYTLARSSTEISFLDVIEAIDGPISINLCLGTENNCPAELNCLMHNIWQKAQNAMKKIFRETKISDVLEQQTTSPFPERMRNVTMDFEQDNTEGLIEELEVKLNRLRVIYEQYFLGIEKRPPSTLHKDVVRIIFELEKRKPRKTAQKFKLRQLVQKFNSYKTYWSRICRQIEDGTYIKHKQKVQKKEASELKVVDKNEENNKDEEIYMDKQKNDKNREKLEEIKRKLGLQENQDKKESININKIYEDLIAAKKKCNESIDKISTDSLARSIEKQMPGLKEKYGTDSINFRVIVKDGKTYLKPYKE